MVTNHYFKHHISQSHQITRSVFGKKLNFANYNQDWVFAIQNEF